MLNITLKPMNYKTYIRKVEALDDLVFEGHYIEEGFLYNFAYGKVAELNNGWPVGFYICKYIEPKHISFHTLAVSPKYENCGIGSMLVKDVITSAKRRRCYTITLNVKCSNKKAIKLYEKFGFSIIGQINNNWYRMRLILKRTEKIINKPKPKKYKKGEK